MEAVISFLSEYRLTGLTVGIFTFLIIGLFHPLVIKAEYWFGTRSWWMFLVLGIAAGFQAMPGKAENAQKAEADGEQRQGGLDQREA